jgi:hypothetical protein
MKKTSELFVINTIPNGGFLNYFLSRRIFIALGRFRIRDPANDLFFASRSSCFEGLVLFLNFLNLAGLPPFSGFFYKTIFFRGRIRIRSKRTGSAYSTMR